MEKDYPILEFDSAEAAMIEPRRVIKPIDIPEHAVACFFQDVLSTLAQQHNARIIKHLRSEIGRHPVYEVDMGGKRLVVFRPGVGAPLAVAFLEEVIALGCRKFIYSGDDVGGSEWDHRHWDKHASGREKLFWLAAEACLLI